MGRHCMLWSGGKDSFLAYSMASSSLGTAPDDWLFVTLVPPSEPFLCHPLGLLARHSSGLGIDHLFVALDLADWRAAYRRCFEALRDGWGVERVFTGDILFAPTAIRSYWLDEMLTDVGLELTLPLAGMYAGPLFERLADLSIEAVITGVAAGVGHPELVGSPISLELLHAAGVYRDPSFDLAGEQGEYHTAVIAGAGRRFADPGAIAPPAQRMDGLDVAVIDPELRRLDALRLDLTAVAAGPATPVPGGGDRAPATRPGTIDERSEA